MTSTLDLFSRLQTSSLQVPIAASILELLPDAALLVHLETQRILAANGAAIALTALTRQQLLRNRVPQLLEEFDLQDDLLASKEQAYFQRYLRMGNGQRRLVRITCHPIGQNTPWFVLRLHKSIHHLHTAPATPVQWETLFVESLERIMHLVHRHTDVNNLWEQVLRAVQPLVDARVLALYLANSNAPVVERLVSLPVESPLPAVLDAGTLALIRTSTLWEANQQPSTPLAKHARQAGLRYLAWAPLGDGNETLGVLCAGDPERRSAPHLPIALRMISRLFTAIIRENSIRENVQRQKARLEQELAFYRTLSTHISVAAFILDTNKRIQWLNPMAEDLFGYQRQEVLQWPIEDVLIGADNFALALERALQGEAIHSLGAETRLHHRNGRPIPVNVQLIPVDPAQADAGVRGLLVLVEDISQKTAMENQNRKLEQQARLGEVTSIFAHEVRNPINNIQMGLQLLSASLPADESIQDTLQRIRQDTERLTHLMETVLAFSRSHTPRQYTALDLRDLLQNLLHRWKPRFTHQGVQQRFVAPKRLPRIAGHAPSLEQVFNNLFSNALRAMPDGGSLIINLAVYTHSEGHQAIRISIADTGIGIPPEIQEHIFSPFFTTNQKNGTGLGLAIVQQIITNHKGTIQVQSYPGGGTIFHIYLPVEKPAPSLPPQKETSL